MNTAHQGQIVAEYRRAKQWTQEDLAGALRVATRTVQRMEEQGLIKDPSKRRLLVGLLGIPAALLGLEAEQKISEKTGIAVNQDRMAFFEEEMGARWDLYHVGGTVRVIRGLDMWISEIVRLSKSTQGSPWHERSLALLTMSYQLKSCALRDIMQYEPSHEAHAKALRVAKELNDPELIAAAMARNGVTLIQENRSHEAIDTLKGALTTIRNLSLPNLRGNLLQALSEAHAQVQNARDCWQCIEQAERIFERYDGNKERSQIRFGAGSVMAQKGIDAVLLHDYDRAAVLLDKSLRTYDPTMLRGRARLLAQQAEAYKGLRLLDASVSTAEEALTLARSVGSVKTIARIQSLQDELTQSQWRKEPSVARLGALLAIQ